MTMDLGGGAMCGQDCKVYEVAENRQSIHASTLTATASGGCT